MEQKHENRQLRVVAYIRKSSEDAKGGEANRQLNSFNYQRKTIQRIIDRENLILLKEPYQDDHTGYKAYVRENFEKMIEYIQENRGKVDGIVCTEINRLARNFGDGGQILWFLQDGLITRIFTYDKIFTDTSADQLMVAINFALAKHSSDETSFRSIAAAESKIQTQKQPSKKAIYGYVTEGKVGLKKWIPNSKIAPLLRKVFEEYATGQYTLEEITDYAFSIGLRSQSPKSKIGRLSKNTIRNRLKDVQYTGIIVYRGERYDGSYPPIISSKLFYQVQSVFEGKKHPKSSHRDYAYTGIIKCTDCGRPLSGTHKKGNTYYRCDKRKEPCNHLHKQYVNEKDLEKDLVQCFESVEIDEKRWQLLREYVFEMSESDKGKYLGEARKIINKIQVVENEKITYAKAVAEGRLDKEAYDKLKEDANARINILRESQIKCENYVDELKSLMFSFLDNVKFITKRFKVATPVNKTEMVDIFCENLRWDGKKLRWDWKKPYFYLAKSSKSATWLGDRDSNPNYRIQSAMSYL
jgi:site-specific DNA recombinase